MLRYEFRMKAELCCAGLSTAAAFRPSSCLSNLSQIRRLSRGAAATMRGSVRCQCDSSAPRKLLHGTAMLQPTLFPGLSPVCGISCGLTHQHSSDSHTFQPAHGERHHRVFICHASQTSHI